MIRLKKFKIFSLLLSVLLLGNAIVSCNAKEDASQPDYQPSASVAVKSFKLNPNIKVMANLDSVFFSIDLDHGIIFNADSLPMGTSVDRLVPVITYPSTVESAEITMTGCTRRNGTVDYMANPSDTLDFSGAVTLKLTADGGNLSRTYRIKINVHKSMADSLMWDKVAISPLPSRLASPKQQKSVTFSNKIFSLIEESDGSMTLASTSDIASAQWEKQALSLNFIPRIRTFVASDNDLYVLDSSNRLLRSSDGKSWNYTGVKWRTLLGGYGDRVLGLTNEVTPHHDIFPRPAGYTPVVIATDFPTENVSNLLTFESKWSDSPYAWLTGGERDGRQLSATWAYDGDSWAKISNNPLPGLSDALLVPYFVYRKTSTSWIQTEYAVTLCLGGRKSDGTLNRTVYLSYDNGVNWNKGTSLLQLPDYIKTFCSADAAIATTPMESSLENWIRYDTPRPVQYRLQYFIEGQDVNWDCPYIYLIGGIDNSGALIPEIRRGVLARLTFAPLF